MRFAYPLAFLIPFAILAIRAFRRRPTGAVPYSQAKLLKDVPPSFRLRARAPVLGALSIAALVLLSIAAARPQTVRAVEEPTMTRNLMLALDTSKSMATADFSVGYRAVSRMAGAKEVTVQFINARKGDRIGVVVFGQNAYVQAPLTLDHGLVAQLVEKLDVGVAGDGTALGDGLGLALKRLSEIPAESKAVVLMTDGVSNSGQVNPIKAAKVARDLGVKVHTIGIGSSGDSRIPGSILGSPFFQPRQAEFDEKTLREIAEVTGGVYFNADSAKSLEAVYAEIDKLEKTAADSPIREVPTEMFLPFAVAGLLCYMAYALLANSFFMKIP